jgi:Carbohydrate-binding module family 5/12
MVGSGDAEFTSERSLLRVLHEELLDRRELPREGGAPREDTRPPVPVHSKPRPPPVPVKSDIVQGFSQREISSAHPSSRPASDAGADSWDSSRKYAVGDQVTYNSRVYHCMIPHQGQVDWTPEAAVSLWKAQ